MIDHNARRELERENSRLARERTRAERMWRQRYRGSDQQGEQALRAWEEIQRKYRPRPDQQQLPSRNPGGIPASRARIAEDDAPRGGAGGSSIPVDRKVIEIWGGEVRVTDKDGVEIDRWVEWNRIRWEDANGNQWIEDLNLNDRTENITPPP